jgi:hypothetical protein
VAAVTNSNNEGELELLRSHPLIQQFASVSDELYEIAAATNPTLKWAIDTARKIMEAQEGARA